MKSHLIPAPMTAPSGQDPGCQVLSTIAAVEQPRFHALESFQAGSFSITGRAAREWLLQHEPRAGSRNLVFFSQARRDPASFSVQSCNLEHPQSYPRRDRRWTSGWGAGSAHWPARRLEKACSWWGCISLGLPCKAALPAVSTRHPRPLSSVSFKLVPAGGSIPEATPRHGRK